MLSDTMEKVNEAEEKARQIVQDAKDRAAEIVETARGKAKQDMAEREADANNRSKAALADARKEGEKEKDRYASEISERLRGETAEVLKKADTAVDALIAGLV